MGFKEFYTLPKEEREKIVKKIRRQLSQRKEIIFAFLYGSFLEDPCFRDIDIGIYLDEKKVKRANFFKYQLRLSGEIKIPSQYLLDIRILNEAPNSFLASVFSRGYLLFSRDDNFLTNLIEKVSAEEISSEAFLKEVFHELVS